MNLLRKTLTTLGGIFLAALLIAALAPKAAHGVAAALVQVTNTASSAVPTEDGPGNFPFGAGVCVEFASAACGSSLPPFLVPVTTSTGAAVKRLVIEDVSASCDTDPGGVFSTLVVVVPFPADSEMSGGSNKLRYFFPLTVIGSRTGAAHSPARMYADPGAQIDTELFGTFDSLGATCVMNFTGHLETK